MKILECSLLILILASPLGCGDSEDRARKRLEEWRKRERAQLIALASRHQACVDWMQSLPEGRSPGGFFTIDVTKALVRTNEQPVALIAELEDLSESNGVQTACFYMLPILPFEIHTDVSLRLFLRCTAEQADTLMKASTQKRFLGQQFALVVRIESVSRPGLAGTRWGDDDTFHSKGVCIDLLPLKPLGEKKKR